MPLLVYPLLGIVVQKLMIQAMAPGQQIFHICFENEKSVDRFMDLVNTGELLIRQRTGELEKQDGTASNPIRPADPGQSELAIRFSVVKDQSVEEVMASGKFDLGVVESDEPDKTRYKLYHLSGSKFSDDALDVVGRRLRIVNDQYLRESFAARKLPNPSISTFEQSAVVPTENPGGNPLLTFVPLMLVLMTVTGAVYPAIDLTAGERERGTIEILVAAPVSRLMLLFGKFVAVLCVAMLTAAANLMAMVVTVFSLGLDSVIFGEAGVSFQSLALIMVLLLVLAAFFSATLLCLTSVARSFKEAQAYLIPLMMVAFAPGLLSLAPNLETSAILSVIPLANVVVVGRDLLAGDANAAHVLTALVSTLFYCFLALCLAARIFGADAILGGGSQLGLRSMLSRPKSERAETPSIGQAIAFLALLFPFFVVFSGLIGNFASRNELPLNGRLLLNAGVTAIAFVGLPLLFVSMSRVSNRPTFFLRAPRFLSVVAAVFLGLSVWTLAYELEVLSLSNERAEEMIEFFTSLKLGFNQIPLPFKLVCLALVPAVCEEFTFRGIFLSALNSKFSSVASVVVTAILFGLFHVFVRDNLFLERFIPSTLMGLLLGTVCLTTRSIFPGMILHALHNGLLLSLSHYEKQLEELGIGIQEQSHLPILWILLALVPISIGAVLLYLARSRSDDRIHDRAEDPVSSRIGHDD